MENEDLAITISHLIGSGGAYVGEKLADRLGIPFLDREIIQSVAQQLNILESEVERREERLTTFWDNFNRSMIGLSPIIIAEFPQLAPSDSELFKTECETIQKIASKSSAIFLGRCGWDILKNHPNHVSILLTANHSDRVKRLCTLYELTEQDARKLIKTNDQERDAYNKKFTQKNWVDARYYDLCVNTSSTGWDGAVEIAEKCILAKIKK
ncbi:MAG: cytidylate kinase-like family protein [Anaerolineae bacterium]|jgi:cytidylate kinase|nr:cytidylate kinase-like family protein [Anaerolineae bacterium]HPW63170.1 cytidylate kinase-like family protein [Cyclobacteriaceae bacterium]